MKCKNCGAEIKLGSTVCEHCNNIPNKRKSKSITKIFTTVVIACILVMIILTVSLFGSDIFSTFYNDDTTISTEQEIPKNTTTLSGQIVSCDKNGIVSVKYMSATYKNIKIKDKDLINWLAETDKSLDGESVMFSTDSDGNISELALSSNGFYIMSKEADKYIAYRDNTIISFTSKQQLDVDQYYEGYFKYPDLNLYFSDKKYQMNVEFSNLVCDNKEITTEKDYYTNEDIMVYKISAGGIWYYCSKDTYASIEAGGSLDDYYLYSNPAFIAPK